MRGINLFLSLLAVLAAGVSVALFMLIGTNTTALEREATNLRSMLDQAQQDREIALAERDESNAEAEAVRREINEYKARNVSLEARNNQLSRDVVNAREQLEARELMELTSTQTIADLREQLLEMRANSAATSAGANAEQVAAYEARIADLEKQLAEARRDDEAADLRAALARVPTDLTGSVLEVGPKSAFVVLNIGSADGAVSSLEMTLRRGSKVIARVRLTDVHESYSVAHVLPSTATGRIRTGDIVSRS